jgi:hypothetical protein
MTGGGGGGGGKHKKYIINTYIYNNNIIIIYNTLLYTFTYTYISLSNKNGFRGEAKDRHQKKNDRGQIVGA